MLSHDSRQLGNVLPIAVFESIAELSRDESVLSNCQMRCVEQDCLKVLVLPRTKIVAWADEATAKGLVPGSIDFRLAQKSCPGIKFGCRIGDVRMRGRVGEACLQFV